MKERGERERTKRRREKKEDPLGLPIKEMNNGHVDFFGDII
jgi:hypothetical protein